jgi:hypothetical protein
VQSELASDVDAVVALIRINYDRITARHPD